MSEAVLRQQLRVLAVRVSFLENQLKKLEKVEHKKLKAENLHGRQRINKSGTAVKINKHDNHGNAAADNSLSARKSAARADLASSVPQEAFIFRDLSPTLKKNEWGVSEEFDYQRNNGFFTKDRTFFGISTVDYGVTNRLQLSLSAPYYYSMRDVQTIGSTVRGTVQSFGDLSARASYALVQETPDWPGISTTASVIIPAGADPYSWSSPNGAYKPGTNPIDSFRSVPSKGQYGVGGTILAYKVFDPIVVFGSMGAQYYFPRTFLHTYTVDGSYGLSFNTGFNFALSEKTTWGMALSGIYFPDLSVNGVRVDQSYQEQYTARFVLTLQLANKFYLEPAVAWGLTSDSPSMQLGVTLRKLFKGPKL